MFNWSEILSDYCWVIQDYVNEKFVKNPQLSNSQVSVEFGNIMSQIPNYKISDFALINLVSQIKDGENSDDKIEENSTVASYHFDLKPAVYMVQV